MPTALIIGAGAQVGQATAEAFTNAGYSVAVASRSNKLGSKYKHFPFDAAKPETTRDLFNKVEAELGCPSVVVYNAYIDHFTDAATPFVTPLADVTSSMAVNAITAFAAAHASIDAFRALASTKALGPEGATFIFTGNFLNDTAVPGLLSFGMGKSAAAHMIKNLALVSFIGEPFKFYYPDQRLEDGTPMWKGTEGVPHAELFLELAKDPKQREWQQTFVAGKGYKRFDRLEATAFGM